MMRIHAILVASLLIVGALGESAQARFGGPPPAGIDPIVPGRAIVRIADAGSGPNATLEQFLAAFNAQFPGTTVLDSIPSVRTHLLQLQTTDAIAVQAAFDGIYVPQGYLRWGELAYEGQAPEGHTGTTWVDGLVSASAYASQYALTTLGVATAQQRSTGANVMVAVLDTGIDPTHPALASHLAPGGFNFITNSTITDDAGDGADNDGDGITDEMAGHGTYVAGLIALVAPDARILPVTVLNSDGVGDGWLFAKGLHYAIDHGVEVINLSLGSTYNQEAVEDAVVEAKGKGIIVVAAAGNFNRDNPRDFPAMAQNKVLGVSATDANDIKGGFSNYSDRLFISAPGVSVPAGGPGTSIVSTLPKGGYAIWEGTSMAVPLVSATVALIRSQHPEWPSTVATWNAVRNVLEQSAADIDQQNPQYADPPELGVGRVDAAAATALGPVAPGTGDLNNDGQVNIDDLLKVIADWGQTQTSADINGDGIVNIDDLLAVIMHWT